MNKLRNISLIIMLPSILLFAGAILHGSVFFNEYRQNQHQLHVQATQNIKVLAGQLQTALSNTLMRLDNATALDIVSTAALDENVQVVVVIDANQQIILSNNFREKYMFAKLQLAGYEDELFTRAINDNGILVKYFKENQELVVYAPLQVIAKGNTLNRKSNAVIFIRYSLVSVYSQLAHTGLIALTKYSVIFLLLLGLYIYFLKRLVILPIKQLTYSIAVTELTNLHPIKQSGFGEIGDLQRAFANLTLEISNNINQLSAREQRWFYAINGAQDGVWDWDIENDHVYYSNRWKEMLGYHATQIKNDIFEWESRIHPDDVVAVCQDITAHFDGRHSFFGNTHRIKCHNGEYRWILSRGQTVSWDTKGNPLRVIGTHTDITSYKLINQQIKYQAQFNEVTMLPNQLQLMSYLSEETQRLQCSGLYAALILIDCDPQNSINGLAEQKKNDDLLYRIARRLEHNKPSMGFIAYRNGFQFVVIFSDIDSNLEQASELSLSFAQRLDSALKQAFTISDQNYFLNCAYGVTLFPAQEVEVKDLLLQASAAMTITEVGQKSNVSLFTKNN